MQVPANAVSNGILILADLQGNNASGVQDSTNVTFRLRIGTSASVITNSLIRTSLQVTGTGRDDDTGATVFIRQDRQHVSIVHYDTTLAVGSLNFVSISATADGTNDTATCNQLTVLGF